MFHTLFSLSTYRVPSNCLKFLPTDLSQQYLGLEREISTKIKDPTTHVIHNAWPVKFNIPLSTFYTNIKGVINLIDMAATAPHASSLMFLSSLSSAADEFPHESPIVVFSSIHLVYHPVNPVLALWNSLLPSIIDSATHGQKNKLVPVPFVK
ncbi:aad450e7-ffad-4f28-842d-3e62654c9db7-CDS [Sclerotinia trifoliorum]|uniref:Aad450e7-ffad-4f28-842d-3e62654c9db7-CDS n=1 Tax=Sclerotinia trifoliorum TaxID=28548 RepID=A0A8H2VYD8_9HELO|nr:aad450e7-ffad-4f28-842d-3e62654c9db7-CDS [Sclerotinia trifoliorum]